jgi:Biopolymer transport protein ExbD/TolR
MEFWPLYIIGKTYIMAAIETAQHSKATGVNKIVKKSTRVDLTPMVDLGFLLITFFVFTSALSKPKVMEVNQPNDKDTFAYSKICASCALTLVPGSNGIIYYYEGMAEDKPAVKTTGFSAEGLRSIILGKKAALASLNDSTKELVLIIKPGDESTCRNFVDMLDEVLINDVKHYFIAEPDDKDRLLIPGVWKH